ncbi:hypothetical protein HDZ31DRAFT_61398 [Schizophyllum fasciatum]
MPLAVDTYTQLPAGRRFSVQYNSKLKPPTPTARPRAATYSSATRPRIPPRASDQVESPAASQHLRKPSLVPRLGPGRPPAPYGRQSELLSPGRSQQRRSSPSPSGIPRPAPSIALCSEAPPSPDNAPPSDASSALNAAPLSARVPSGTARYIRKNAHTRQQTIAKPDPNVLLRRLEGLLPPTARVPHLVQFDVLQALHDKEEMERFSRDVILQTLEEDSNNLAVFGESLTKVCLFASTRDGHRNIPSVVVSCMEELKVRHAERPIALSDVCAACDPALLATFDSPTTLFGAQALGVLSQRPTNAIISLLLAYLDALPESLLFPGIADGLLVWCFDDFSGSDRKVTISVAQVLLRLLPSASIDLLSYLLESLVDLGLGEEASLGRTCTTFGRCILGGAERDCKKGQVVLRWLLEKWTKISSGLMSDNVGVEVLKSTQHSPSSPPSGLSVSTNETPRKSSWTGSFFGGAFGRFDSISKRIFDDDAIVYPGVLCSDSRSTSTGSAESASTYASTTDSDASDTAPQPYPCAVCRQCTPFRIALESPDRLSLHSAHDICRLLARRADQPEKLLFAAKGVEQVEFHLPDDAAQRADMLEAMAVFIRTLRGCKSVVALGFSSSAAISVEGDGAADAAQELGVLPASWRAVPRLCGRREGVTL